MGKIESFMEKHLAWIASIVIAVGFYIAVIQSHALAIEKLQMDVQQCHEQVEQLSRVAMRLDMIEKSLEEMKGDIKEIKKVLYKPVVGGINERTVSQNP